MARAICAKIAVLVGVTVVAGWSAPPASLPDLRSASDAAVTARLGDRAYRNSDFGRAEALYRSAFSADPGYARAVWGLGRIEELHFRRSSARDYYAAAFRLDPRDPQIIQSYASMITDREAQAILVRNYLATGGDPSLWALQ